MAHGHFVKKMGKGVVSYCYMYDSGLCKDISASLFLATCRLVMWPLGLLFVFC